MNRPNRSKLNQLLLKWPRGTIFVQSHLTREGISKQLTAIYQKSVWLRRIGHGAFARADDDTVDWMSGVYAIQDQLKLHIHAGGKTALQLLGYAHFLPLGKNYPVWFFGETGNKLPAWFKTFSWGVDVHYSTAKLFSRSWKFALTEQNRETYRIKISTPERAILELLYFVPDIQSFSEAQLLMEGLTTLRPKLVQELLECCNSIKVKRLFLYLAESCHHAWFKKIDLKKINLGKGKRMIIRQGRLDTKYQITVPHEAE